MATPNVTAMARLLIWLVWACAVANCAEHATRVGGPVPPQMARIVADASGTTWFAATQFSRVVIGKLDPAGHILFLRTVSGSGSDVVKDLALDGLGNVYVAGKHELNRFSSRERLTVPDWAGLSHENRP